MRVLTRPDFDGIVCAVLLSDALEIKTPTVWVEPNAMQHGQVDVRPGDIIANLSYNENCSMWFDHHESNIIDKPFEGVFKLAPSAAGVIFEHYKDHDTYRFSRDYTELIKATDKIDSAQLSVEEVLAPEKDPYLALSITIASHNMVDEPYWNRLVELMKVKNIHRILDVPEVKERVEKAVKENKAYNSTLIKHTSLHGHIAVTDFRPLGYTPKGNRFMVFHLHPEAIVNIRVRYDPSDNSLIRISVGHSIFNRTCNVHAGMLCSRFGGGGHRGAGACSVPLADAEDTMNFVMKTLTENKPLED